MAGYVILYEILILSMQQKKRLNNHYNEFIYLKFKVIIFLININLKLNFFCLFIYYYIYLL